MSAHVETPAQVPVEAVPVVEKKEEPIVAAEVSIRFFYPFIPDLSLFEAHFAFDDAAKTSTTTGSSLSPRRLAVTP